MSRYFQIHIICILRVVLLSSVSGTCHYCFSTVIDDNLRFQVKVTHKGVDRISDPLLPLLSLCFLPLPLAPPPSPLLPPGTSFTPPVQPLLFFLLFYAKSNLSQAGFKLCVDDNYLQPHNLLAFPLEY